MADHAIRGMLSLDELRQKVETGEIETVITAFSDLYGRYMGKRVTGEFFLDHTVESGIHACNYLLTVDMPMEPVPGYHYANWEQGYGDFHCVPDLNSLRQATWLDKTALVICDLWDEKTDQMVSVAPRSILRRQLDAAQADGAIGMGASELEYFIFDETYKTL